MIPAVIIAKKRDGHELSTAEIRYVIENYVSGDLPDYQMSALAMAIYLQGMTDREISDLTQAMLNSGAMLPRSSTPTEISVYRVDKHSTGGLGDKTSLILAPMLAAAGLQVPMISGRGLGITGGTLDKLEAIEGFRTNLTSDEIQRQLDSVGCVITGTTDNIAPADRRLYALRDVTGTVPSIPLITASIMCKKLAESLDALVLDVKWGSAAFMTTREQAIQLASKLVATGKSMNVATTAILSDMNQPLGNAVGNACEVNESIAVLKGEGPREVRRLTVELGADLLVSIGRYDNPFGAAQHLESLLDDGSAWQKWTAMIEAQGGSVVDRLPVATEHLIAAPQAGFITAMDGQILGQAVIHLGGGRQKLGEAIRHDVGLRMDVRLGDRVERGQPLMFVQSPTAPPADFCEKLKSAVTISDSPTMPPTLLERLVVNSI